jgi:tripartite-type tricarboxylate transporter receptor subunit TctC
MTLIKIMAAFVASFTILSAGANPYQEIPKNITFLNPYGPGGIVDVQYQPFEKFMASKGVQMQISYKPGANSSIAAQEFLSGPKDGSVIMMNSTSNSWLAEKRLGQKVIEPIISTGGVANVIITQPGNKYEKYEDFVKGLKAGDTDIKIGWHAVSNVLMAHQFSNAVNASVPLLVPYKTSIDSARDVVGGHLPFAFSPMSTVKPLLESGKVKIVFGFASNPNTLPPGTLDIKKRIPNWRHGEIFFVGLPPGTDERIIKAWTAIWKEYLSLKETDEALQKAFIGKDIGNADHVNSMIQHQADGFKKYNIEMK